jgi:hypothetical protein
MLAFEQNRSLQFLAPIVRNSRSMLSATRRQCGGRKDRYFLLRSKEGHSGAEFDASVARAGKRSEQNSRQTLPTKYLRKSAFPERVLKRGSHQLWRRESDSGPNRRSIANRQCRALALEL